MVTKWFLELGYMVIINGRLEKMQFIWKGPSGFIIHSKLNYQENKVVMKYQKS